MSATDNLGPHLLGRNPLPPDPRDYRLEDFLEAHERLSGTLTPDTTLSELHSANQLNAWHDIYAFWAWFKANIIGQPAPGPAPTPTPPTPAGKPAGGWHDPDDPVLDQGQTPHCVGFTGADTGNAGQPDKRFADADGDRIYYLCQPGDVGKPISQQQGSDSRTLCKVLVQLGVIGTYAFANTEATIVQFIDQHGAIGVGSDWTNGMFNPDGDNYIRPTGSVAGGHEYSLVDYLPSGHGSVSEATFKLLNHWGSNWGDSGYAYIRTSDAWSLISNGGDAWAGLRKVTP